MAMRTKPNARRREILAAAEKVFEARGYASSTMDAVAEQACVSKGSIYNYFESKQDLFEKLFVEALSEDAELQDRRFSECSTSRAKLLLLWDDLLDRMEKYKRIGALILEFWAAAAHEQRVGNISQRIEELHRNWIDCITRVIEEGTASGEFKPQPDVESLALVISAIANGAIVHAILVKSADVDQNFIAAAKRAMLEGLLVGDDDGRGEFSDGES